MVQRPFGQCRIVQVSSEAIVWLEQGVPSVYDRAVLARGVAERGGPVRTASSQCSVISQQQDRLFQSLLAQSSTAGNFVVERQTPPLSTRREFGRTR